MTIFTQVVPIVLVVLLSMIVNRIATIALTLTGMSRQSARFQARSALTGAGFTTSESESVVNHPVRRRIVMTLMLVGSAGIVTVIGTLAATTSRSVAASRAGAPGLPLWATYLLMIAGIGAVLLLLRFPPIDRALSRAIRRSLRRYTDLEVRDYEALLEIHGGYSISELLVRPNDWLADKTLAELRPNDEGILVLGVQRDKTYLGAPTGRLRVRAGDTLLVYGPQDRIVDLDERPSGPTGDAMRSEAIEDEADRRRRDQVMADDHDPDHARPARDPLEEGL
nr:TrkA C-terminal domain-containing protein [Salsipaludibacter albus]